MRTIVIGVVLVLVIAVVFAPVGGIVEYSNGSDPTEVTIEIVTERVTTVVGHVVTVVENPGETRIIEPILERIYVVVIFFVNVVLPGDNGDPGVNSCSGDPAFFEVSDLRTTDSVARGENATVETTIENTGGKQATQNLTFTVEGKDVSTGSNAVDVVFLIDDSGSMDEEIESVKRELNTFSSRLESSDVDARFAVITFTDEVRIQQGFTDDVSDTKETIDAVSTYGETELNYRAIETALTSPALDARPNARTVIIDFTDEQSDREGSDPTKGELVDELDSTDSSYIAVSPDESRLRTIENGDDGYDPALDKRELAEDAESGAYFDLYEGDFNEKFREEISAEVVNITNESKQAVSLDCGERTDSAFEIDTSRFPAGSYTVTVESENDSESGTFVVERRSSQSSIGTRSLPPSVLADRMARSGAPQV